MEEAIRWHRSNQNRERLAAATAWPEEGFLIVTKFGGPVDPRNLLRWWHALCESGGVPRRRFHATRHTAATLMLESGASINQISKVLGHSSIAITGDIYAKPSSESVRSAVQMGVDSVHESGAL